MTIRALIFDFDGLILDTETPEVEVWKTIYAEHGQAYPREYWCQTIGGWGLSTFDPATALQELTPRGLDLESLRTRHRHESNSLILTAPVMPGVPEILAAARRLGLRCAIGSSSERSWVVPHLTRLELLGFFDPVITGDDVPKGRTKPHPDIYLKVLSVLQLPPHEVLVLEDSPNGVTAAHAAGLRAVGVPNPVTSMLEIDADLMLDSLGALPLEEILRRFENPPRIDGVQRTVQDTAS